MKLWLISILVICLIFSQGEAQRGGGGPAKSGGASKGGYGSKGGSVGGSAGRVGVSASRSGSVGKGGSMSRSGSKSTWRTVGKSGSLGRSADTSNPFHASKNGSLNGNSTNSSEQEFSILNFIATSHTFIFSFLTEPVVKLVFGTESALNYENHLLSWETYYGCAILLTWLAIAFYPCLRELWEDYFFVPESFNQ